LSGFVYPGYEGTETVHDRIRTVQETPKPFILIKTLGAGRIPPDEGLHFISENAKPNDLISMGFGTIDEADESIQLIKKYF
jgi:phage protein U